MVLLDGILLSHMPLDVSKAKLHRKSMIDMRVMFEQKKPGRQCQTIAPIPIELESCPTSVGALIEETVRICVAAYNAKAANSPGREDLDSDDIHVVHDSREIEDLAESGRIAFGMVYSDKTEDPEKAVANALQCYEDGLFRIFLNGRPLGSLNEEMQLNENDRMTVVRLTMLAGRLW